MIDTKVRAVIVINTAGQVLFKRGMMKSDNFIQSLGALSAGIFNATISIAKLLGDRYFDNVSQEGKKINLFYNAVNEDTIILSVYDSNAIIGVIQVMSKQLSAKVLSLMEDEVKRKSGEFDDEYKDEVENLLDNMFN